MLFTLESEPVPLAALMIQAQTSVLNKPIKSQVNSEKDLFNVATLKRRTNRSSDPLAKSVFRVLT